MPTHSLFELNEYIRRVISLNFPEALWVKAEIGQVNESRGHYFFQLIEKSADELKAQAGAILWQRQYLQLRRKLGATLDQLLQQGLEVQLQVQVDFEERYGMRLTVLDIDPAYSVGQLELRRQAIVDELSRKGLLEKNAQHPLPPVVQRIAVLSSPDAAGFQDFLEQLRDNPLGYRFQLRLFPIAVQGKQVEPELLQQLQRIAQSRTEFDCAVLIRGGGSKLDLAAFDSQLLGEAVAELPLPLLTGIGHETDQTVVDLTAARALKTPTAVADLLLFHNQQFESRLLDAGSELRSAVQGWLHQARLRLHQHSARLQLAAREQWQRQDRRLETGAEQLWQAARRRLETAARDLSIAEKDLQLLDPRAILARGYSLTLKDGQALRSVAQAMPGDQLFTHLADGNLRSIVQKNSDHE